MISASYPTTGKPLPPPIDPGVMSSILQIRRLVDEATDLAVRASSGLSAVELGSVRNAASYIGTTWAAAQSLGLKGWENVDILYIFGYSVLSLTLPENLGTG